MNYKMISMDFDGTLLTSNKNITYKTKNKILKHKNNNYIIVGITARNLSSVKLVCDINMFNYLILNNGACIYDVKNRNVININSFDKSTAAEITNYFESISERIDYCTLNHYYNYKKRAQDDRDFIIKINNINEINEPIARMNIFLKLDKDIKKYKEYIEKNYKELDAFIMLDTDNTVNLKWISLNLKEMNKFETLKYLCKTLKISTEEVVFFGDNENDLMIINKVGLGVAMGNALEEIKKKAKKTTLSNDEDGIAYFLENKL